MTECIPNNEMHQYLLENIDTYSEEIILNIIRCLLHSYNRPADCNKAEQYKNTKLLKWYAENGITIEKSEYYSRLIHGYEAWEGLTWIVQLTRISPMEAIKALSLYMSAECLYIPDFRLMGIGQVIDIIEKIY